MIHPRISRNKGVLGMHQQTKTLQKDITIHVTLSYLLYLPNSQRRMSTNTTERK
jgi:hypothetical protein